MTIGERIKELRKSSGLTLEKFGAKICITAQSVSAIEKGINTPADRTISLICREFHVNEDWLRTGTGEMFAKSYESELERMCAERGLSHADFVAIRNIMEMPKEAREVVTAYMLKFAQDILSEQSAAQQEPKNVHNWTREELDEAYKRQADAEQRDREKGTGESSTGSPNDSGADCA